MTGIETCQLEYFPVPIRIFPCDSLNISLCQAHLRSALAPGALREVRPPQALDPGHVHYWGCGGGVLLGGVTQGYMDLTLTQPGGGEEEGKKSEVER